MTVASTWQCQRRYDHDDDDDHDNDDDDKDDDDDEISEEVFRNLSICIRHHLNGFVLGPKQSGVVIYAQEAECCSNGKNPSNGKNASNGNLQEPGI